MPVARSIGWSAALRSAVSLAAAALVNAVAAGDLLVTPSGSGEPNIPIVFYTDLSDGPKTGGLNNNGVWVTIFGRNFGATRGTGSVALGGGAVVDYFSWSDTKIVVQLGSAVSTGNFVVQNNDGLSSSAGGRFIKPNGTSNDFTVRAGNIKFIAATGTNGTGTHASPYVQAINRIRDNFTAGDIWYFRGGTYNQQLVVNGWGNNVLNVGGPQSGSANAHTAFLAYPGESVTLDIGNPAAIYLRDNNETVCSYVTFSNFALRGYQGFSGGAQTSANSEVSNSGGQFAYLVNCDIQGRHPGDAATGIVTFGGNNCMALGNVLRDTGGPGNSETPSYANQNHGFYVQVGTDNMVIAFNTLRNLNMGATIQVHTDSFFEYTNVRILYNHFINTSPSTVNMRGIVVGHMYGSSTGCIVGNVFDGVGNTDGFPPIIIYGGQWDVDNNTVIPRAGLGACVLLSNQVSTETYRNNGANYAPPQVRMRNNIFVGSGGYISFGGAGTPAGVFTTAQLTAANNLYTGAGAGPSYDTTKVEAAAGMVNVAGEDYRLTSGSAARNAGTLASLNANALVDRFGVTRPQESLIDIGAHEYIPVAPSLGVYNQGYQQQGLGSNPLTVVAGNSQASGSSLLIFSAAKLDDVTSVTHNKTGALSNLGSLAYTFWAPYGARLDAVPALTGGAGQSASISLISGNATDEKTMFVLEVRNGQTITLATPVELPASAASVVTGNGISSTGPAVVFCCVWGDGNISTPMNLTVHADSIAEGWQQIGDVSIDGIAHIQGALAVRVVAGAGGPYSCKWTFTPAQRALFFTGKVEA